MKQLDPLYLVKAFDKTPPCAWRGMAIETSRGRPTRQLSLRKLVEASGIPRRTMVAMLYRITAAKMTLEQISRLSAACGVNMLSRNPYYYFLRKHPSGNTDHLRPQQLRRLEKAMALWEKQQQAKRK